MLLLLNTMAALPAETTASGTGLEWMVVASFLVPAVLLAVLLYLGARHTV